MEEFVRKVLSRYTSFVSEKQLYERWLDMRENSDVREALVMTDMKITMIQSWFNLLNADERFVIEKHLLDELEWPRVAFSFTKKWDGEFTRTERSLVTYQASGLKKIISFVEAHRDSRPAGGFRGSDSCPVRGCRRVQCRFHRKPALE